MSGRSPTLPPSWRLSSPERRRPVFTTPARSASRVGPVRQEDGFNGASQIESVRVGCMAQASIGDDG